jgi:hypothetical protein
MPTSLPNFLYLLATLAVYLANSLANFYDTFGNSLDFWFGWEVALLQDESELFMNS